ncbi:MAG: carbon storage regulator [Patescibacteria group bacterium]|nr:carbon storage regulator [Patescibacteria group bacterium]
MLSLKRRKNEEVVIKFNGVIGVVRVQEVHGRTVRLGFDFPQEVLIDRKEIHEQREASE